MVSDCDLDCRNQEEDIMKDMVFTNARYMISIESVSQTERVGEGSGCDKARGTQDDDEGADGPDD